MQLPILAAPEDAEKIVRYLNNKVSGATSFKLILHFYFLSL